MNKYALSGFIFLLVAAAGTVTASLAGMVGGAAAEIRFDRVSPMLMQKSARLEAAGDLEGAAMALQTALREGFIATKNYREAHSRLGYIRWKQHRYEEARTALEAAIESPQPNWSHTDALIDTLLQLSDPSAALTVAGQWKEVAARENDMKATIEAGAGIGRSLLASGKNEEAIQELEASVRLYAGSAAAVPLAQWHADHGDPAKANALLTAFLLAGGNQRDSLPAREILSRLHPTSPAGQDSLGAP